LAFPHQVVAETGSTNADLLARLAVGEDLAEGFWLIADRQSAGRGRQGRPWLDAPGNFMGSTLVKLGEGDPPASSLSFVTALAVYAAVSGQIAAPASLQLKWPNDVLLAGDKFCGILLERDGQHAVIGIGVNLATAPAVAGRRTLALAQRGARPDRDLFAAELAARLALELARWRKQGTGPMFSRWQTAAHPIGTRLTVHDGLGACVTGAYDGLEPDGALRLVRDDGTRLSIHAGDVAYEGSN
jgi:BirA family transcriptional regulator, biotin operon repressor / biotin---[acetyl-CoA-carboxylase] ligase